MGLEIQYIHPCADGLAGGGDADGLADGGGADGLALADGVAIGEDLADGVAFGEDLDEGVDGELSSESVDNLSAASKQELNLMPATASKSTALWRSNMTLARMWNDPDASPS